MGLEELANLGELVGGLAVVVSVLYLAYELRANTNSVRAASAASSQDSLAVINELIASTPELALIASRTMAATSLEDLSEEERFRAASLLRANMQRFEAMFFRYEAGLLDARVWDVRRTWLSGFNQLPAVAEWWADERESSIYTPAFIEDLEGAEGIPIGQTGRRQIRLDDGAPDGA